ncbi:hypothetical protein NDU88_003862 [Pleurodeles waltl]|uniref:Uncharacterized protein n=1 Tax=Pleurodeles waltl TaxID=8319 RepID=A0AAV7W680_PLEWA|nr:hypothetical protein NDU88_003862 [Pleurodeles waltl]
MDHWEYCRRRAPLVTSRPGFRRLLRGRDRWFHGGCCRALRARVLGLQEQPFVCRVVEEADLQPIFLM